jgi:photosystem II stability/assembly factor-like uncharacterized protein
LAISDLEVWAVGANGALINSIDGGISWTDNQSFTSDFYTIFATQGWLWIGGKKILIKSTDNGTSWNQIATIPQDKSLLKIAFFDQLYGWCIMDDADHQKDLQESSWTRKIYKTTDGGSNWTEITNLITSDRTTLGDFEILGQSTVRVVMENSDQIILAESTDGGFSWNMESMFSNESVGTYYYAVLTSFGNEVWIGGDFCMFRKEANKSWYSKNSGINNPKHLQFTSAETGWLIGEPYGTLYKSVNGGKNWFEQGVSGNDIANVYSVSMFDDMTGWAVGKNGKIYYTSTGGN